MKKNNLIICLGLLFLGFNILILNCINNLDNEKLQTKTTIKKAYSSVAVSSEASSIPDVTTNTTTKKTTTTTTSTTLTKKAVTNAVTTITTTTPTPIYTEPATVYTQPIATTTTKKVATTPRPVQTTRPVTTTTTATTTTYINNAAYAPSDLRYMGVINWNGYRWTWYSERVLPGTGLNIPGRYTDVDGFVCDGNGYICLAASSVAKGTIVSTPFGRNGKVYDCGCAANTLDVYVNW